MVISMRAGSAAYKMVRATLVITTPLPSLENSSKRDGAQLKKTAKSGTFVVHACTLSTDGTRVSTVKPELVGTSGLRIAAGNRHGGQAGYATCFRITTGNWHGVRYHQAMNRWGWSVWVKRKRAGDKTSKNDGEDGSVDEKFHGVVTSDCLWLRIFLEHPDKLEYSATLA
jgi:hypothetical protein